MDIMTQDHSSSCPMSNAQKSAPVPCESRRTRHTLATKVTVTVVALIVFGLHITLPNDAKLDAVALGLMGLAALPWLSSLIDSAEFPGGWKIQFRKELETQKRDLNRLRFLIANFVTDAEARHLEKLRARTPFPFLRDDTTSFFLGELRRLRSLKLIEGQDGKGIRTLEVEGGDVGAHFRITRAGREYLRLREEAERENPETARTDLGDRE